MQYSLCLLRYCNIYYLSILMYCQLKYCLLLTLCVCLCVCVCVCVCVCLSIGRVNRCLRTGCQRSRTLPGLVTVPKPTKTTADEAQASAVAELDHDPMTLDP